ncbi:MAG: response regulator [Myxococcales bacterium]|nr:response regulator [Myxococcales bacterium]
MESSNGTILYVDDEVGNRVVFDATFADDFDIVLVDSGETALEYLEENEVAIIVSDQRMPGLSGDELLTQVRQRWPRTIRLIVTGYADVDTILRAVNEGLVARYVVKPWDQHQLRDILRWGLEAYDLTAQDHGEVIQARLIESEKLASLGAMHLSFMHEIGTLLSYMTSSVAELNTIVEYQEDLVEVIGADSSRPSEHWHPLLSFLNDSAEILENLNVGTSLLSHLRAEVTRLISGVPGSTTMECAGDDVRRAVEFAISANRAEAVLTKVDVRSESLASVPPVAISVEDLMQVIINLTRNAIQSHSPDAQGNEVIIRVTSELDKRVATISVIDNGEGMSPELLSKVGRQFHTTKKTGTGLGTYRCRILLSRVGGSLTYQSDLTKGTTATITLPLVEEA